MTRADSLRLWPLEEPIRVALNGYSDISDGKVQFDVDEACLLEPTPNKPYYASSATPVRYMGEVISNLYVIAFAFQDGTGQQGAYRLDQINTGDYPADPKVIPRQKTGIISEAHLTLLSKRLDVPGADPVVYSGSLDLLSLESTPWAFEPQLVKIASLGQADRALFLAGLVTNGRDLKPTATLTVGYKQSDNRPRNRHNWDHPSKRFGDPHAVFNNLPYLQVCAFLAITSTGNDSLEQLAPLDALEAKQPELLSTY